MPLHCFTDWNQLKSEPPGRIGDLAATWNTLARRCEAHTLFQTYEWHEAWWNAFQKNYELRLVVYVENDEWQGIAPLCLSEKKINGLHERVLGFMGSDNFASDYADFIIPTGHSDVLEQFLGWIETHMHEWTLLDLVNLPEWSEHLPLSAGHFKKRGGIWKSRMTCDFLYDAPAVSLSDPEEGKKILSKKSLKRHHNHFAKSGNLRLFHCESEEQIEGYLERFFEQHIARRAITEAPSIFLEREHRDFYHALIRALFPQGWLLFTVVEFDGEPIAMHFGFLHEKTLLWYKPTFDIRFLKRSPGEVLLKFLFETALEKKLTLFDFTVGSEEFKYRFANEIRAAYRVRIYRRLVSLWFMRARRIIAALRRRLTGEKRGRRETQSAQSAQD